VVRDWIDCGFFHCGSVEDRLPGVFSNAIHHASYRTHSVGAFTLAQGEKWSLSTGGINAQ